MDDAPGTNLAAGTKFSVTVPALPGLLSRACSSRAIHSFTGHAGDAGVPWPRCPRFPGHSFVRGARRESGETRERRGHGVPAEFGLIVSIAPFPSSL